MKEKYNEFVDNNKEALQLLAQKVKSVDTVRGVKTWKETQGRQYAIKVLDEWLTELWNIKTDNLPEPEETDELFKIIDESN